MPEITVGCPKCSHAVSWLEGREARCWHCKHVFTIPTREPCTQCGTLTLRFSEGVCEDCCHQNQRELDEHNAAYDHWARMSGPEREEAIRNAR